MDNLDKILNDIYKIKPYRDYFNITKFKCRGDADYGEVTQKCTDTIVKYFEKHFNPNTIFYDLGCGLGKMVIHIGLQYNPKKSCGIELSKERIKCGFNLKDKYCKDNNIISFIEGSFFENDISDATVVYCDNQAFREELLPQIIDILPKNCLFICRKSHKDIEMTEIDDKKLKTTYFKTKIFYLIK